MPHHACMRRSIIAIVAGTVVLALVVIAVAFRPFGGGSKVETATVARGSLDATIELAGTVIPQETHALTFGTTGTVTSVTTHVGDVVAPGQILATIDDTLAKAQARAAETALASAQARLAADTGGLTSAQLAQAQDSVTQAQQAVTTATSALSSARTQRDASVAAAKGILDAAQARLDADIAAGAADAILSIDRLAVQAASANLATVTTQGDAAVAQANAALSSARSALTAAQHGYAVRTASAPTALLAADEAAIAAAEASLATARQALAGATIASPIVGTITEVGVQVGDRAGSLTGGASGLGSLGGGGGAAGATGRIVVADLSALRISATASEIDVVSLVRDQAATITLDALPDVSLAATICELGTSGSAASGVVEYPVTLCLARRDPQLRVGMSANISIVLAHRENVLIVPTPAITTAEGRSVARVLRSDGRIDTVEVVVGISSGTRLEIRSGLAEGDKVVVGSTSGSGG